MSPAQLYLALVADALVRAVHGRGHLLLPSSRSRSGATRQRAGDASLTAFSEAFSDPLAVALSAACLASVRAEILEAASATLGRFGAGGPQESRGPCGVARAATSLGRLHDCILGQAARRAAGEFQTPPWLVELTLGERGAGYRGRGKLIDPACGSGAFLARAAGRARAAGLDAAAILEQVHGADRSPLAVVLSRAAVLLSLAGLCLPEQASVGVELRDLILEPPAAPEYDFVVGNPPWVRWSLLPRSYREATFSRWRELGLFAEHGLHAKIGRGELDLAALFTVAAVRGHLRQDGTLAMVLPAELFRSKTAGEGLRRLFASEAGERAPGSRRETRPETGPEAGPETMLVSSSPMRLCARRLHDLTALRPFPAVANKTVVLLAVSGPPRFPVLTLVYSPRPAGAADERHLPDGTAGPVRRARHASRCPDPDASLDDVLARLVCEQSLSEPISHPCSPWQTRSPDPVAHRIAHHVAHRDPALRGPSDYRARLGVRADPFGVFLLRLVGNAGGRRACRGAPVLLTLENEPRLGKRALPKVRVRLEAEALFPLLRGRDIRRFVAQPVLLMPLPNCGIRRAEIPSEEELAARLPHTFAYLSRFRDVLLARADYWAYFGFDLDDSRGKRRIVLHRRVRHGVERSSSGPRWQGATAPFFAVSKVGPYTFAPWKCVWPRMASGLRAAVVSALPPAAGLPPRPVLPCDTVSFVPCASSSEAHYLCALLNSEPLGRHVRSFSACGRGFGAPSILAFTALPRYDRRRASHRALAALSLRAHAAVAADDQETMARLEAALTPLSLRALDTSAY